MNSNSKLVYSTDPKDQAKLAAKPVAPSVVIDLSKITAVFRLEKSGRGGKTVTVIDQLPAHQTWLEETAKKLKATCGVGGTSGTKNGVGFIEIQGDQRSRLQKALTSMGIKFRGMVV